MRNWINLFEAQAYHGTSQDFEHFSLRYINTGEGNQAYGYGIYLAQNPDIADYYAASTSQHDPDDRTTIGSISVDGSPFNARLPAEQLTPLQLAALEYYFSGSQAEAIRDTQDMIEFTQNPSIKTLYREALDVLLSQRLAGRVEASPPKVYHVNITRPDTDFLLWREPFDKQSPSIQRIMNDHQEMNGSQFYRYVTNELAKKHNISAKQAQKFASMQLYRDGIAGIKYLDAGGLKTGLYNYVVFNPREIRIEKIDHV